MLFSDAVRFGNDSERMSFKIDLFNRLSIDGSEHLDCISIVLCNMDDIHIKLRVYGRDYDLDYCKCDIYNSLCEKRKYVNPMFSDKVYSIYRIEVEDLVELGDWTDSKDNVIRQTYTKKLEENGDLVSIELLLEIIEKD